VQAAGGLHGFCHQHLHNRRLHIPCVTASGGVSCNRALRRELAAACERAGCNLRLGDPSLCTDNAAMIGILAERKFLQNAPPTSLKEEVRPAWTLDETLNTEPISSPVKCT
jgi:tRNA A37 threonylcarbamoyltransferase TsaD